MVLTPSNMMPLGTTAPVFDLTDTISGETLSLQDLRSDIATVVLFICNHCPYVKHLQRKLVEVAEDYENKGISFIAISSNDADHYPDDAPEKMAEVAEQFSYPFPYLYDATQEVAKAYHATCTPDLFVFDRGLKCVYRGQFDDSRPGSDTPVTGASLTQALDCILDGEAVPADQKPSVGCSIKWKK